MTPAAIAAGLRKTGVVVHTGPLDRRSFFAVAAALGSVFHEKSIYVDAAQPYYIRKPAPIPFHTDHARANVVAWLCEVPEACENRYLDARRLYGELTARQRTALADVTCYCPYPRESRLDPKRPAVNARVVAVRRGVPRFFWVPERATAGEPPPRGATPWIGWPPTAAARAALDAFRTGIEVEPEAADVSVQLARGEAVFVDNNRFLHGRGRLPRTSPRQLYRLWINTDGWQSARYHRLVAPTLTRD